MLRYSCIISVLFLKILICAGCFVSFICIKPENLLISERGIKIEAGGIETGVSV